METFQNQLHIRFQNDDYQEIMKAYYKNRRLNRNAGHAVMVYGKRQCILIDDGERLISETVKRLMIEFYSDNIDIYFPLVIDRIRVIPETIEGVDIEVSNNPYNKLVFVEGLIVDGIKAFHDNIATMTITGNICDPLIVEKQRALPTNLKSITFHRYKSFFIIDNMSIFPDNVESVYIYNDTPYDHPFGIVNGSDIIKAFPDSITKLHYHMITKKTNIKPDIFFMGGITLLPENLTILDLTIDDTIDFMINGIRVIPNKTQKVTFRYESNSLISFIENDTSIFPDSVMSLQIFAKDLKIKILPNGSFGLPLNIKKLILDARSISIDSCNNNKMTFPDSLRKLQICGDGMKSKDILIMSTNIKKLTLQLSDWNDIQNKGVFPEELDEINILRKCYPIQKINANYNEIAVKLCYKNGLCILPPNLKSIEIDFNDVTLIVQKIITIIACLPYPIADEIISEL